MSKERSGFWNQGSLGWGIGIGITLGAVYYLLSRRPHKEVRHKKQFRSPSQSSSEAFPANLAKGPKEAAGGADEASVFEIHG